MFTKKEIEHHRNLFRYAVPDGDDISDKNPKWIKKIFEDGMISFPGLNHMYFSKSGVIVSEPYNISQEQIKKLILFCEGNKLNFELSGTAKHHPYCMRVKIYPREN
jgi:hypothetical protein